MTIEAGAAEREADLGRAAELRSGIQVQISPSRPHLCWIWGRQSGRLTWSAPRSSGEESSADFFALSPSSIIHGCSTHTVLQSCVCFDPVASERIAQGIEQPAKLNHASLAVSSMVQR